MALSLELLKPYKAVIGEYRQWALSDVPRIGMGLPWFDNCTRGGMAPGEVCMLIARTGVGKTQLSLNMIAANAHVPTVFFSLEMSAAQLAARLAAISTNTSAVAIEDALNQFGTHPALEVSAERFQNLYICDKSGLTPKDMSALVEAASDEIAPIRFVCIDFLERVGGIASSAGEQVSKAAKKVKDMAKDTGTSVLLLHQVSRSGGSEGHEPLTLSSMKNGGEDDVDYAIGAFRPSLNPELDEHTRKQKDEQYFLQFLKNRHGEAPFQGVCHRYNRTTLTIRPWDEPFKDSSAPLLEYEDF
jgi:replicative DNA helicase